MSTKYNLLEMLDMEFHTHRHTWEEWQKFINSHASGMKTRPRGERTQKDSGVSPRWMRNKSKHSKNMTNKKPNPEKKLKVVNFMNYDHTEHKGKKFTMPSQTIPDQTMSMRTILERYSQGLNLTQGKEELWDDDPELSHGIHPKKLDLVDVQEIAQSQSRLKTDLLDKHAKHAEKVKEAKAKKKSEQEEFKKFLENAAKDDPNKK